MFPTSFHLLAFNTCGVRCARALRPDVIQAHDLNTLLGGALVKRMLGVPLVYDSHELFLERNLGRRSRARDKLVWAPIERFCIHRCDAVFSVAESICLHLAMNYKIPEPHLIRNVQPYEPPAARITILAEELGIPEGIAIVLYPGAITIHRGLEEMIDSAPYLERAAYVIMGYAQNATYLASLRTRAGQRDVLDRRVFFREAVPIRDVVRYTASADLGIVPTQNICLSYLYESSNKIFHCLMAGVPVVMSDHAEKRMLVEKYRIGWLFDETDPRAIAATVNAALADRKAYDGVRQHCLRAARTLNWEHEEHRLRTIFADLLAGRMPPVPGVRLLPGGACRPVESRPEAPSPAAFAP